MTVRVAASPAHVDEATSRVGSYGGTVRTRADSRFIAQIPANALRGFAKSPAISFIDTPTQLETAGSITSEGAESVSAPAAHTYGVTGEGVEVAVIDSGFDASNPEIRDNVVSYRAFDGDGEAWSNESGQHGTATAEIVVDTAPNVSLHLYRVKYELDLLNAIEDINERGSVDVVSMSLGLNNGPFDGTSALDDAIADSVASGTTWFVSAGNAGGGHHHNVEWTDADADEFLEFSGSDETLGITHATSGPLTVTVSWDDYENRDQDYDIALYDAATNEQLAVSTNPQTGPSGAPSEETIILAASETTSNMYLVVNRYDANGTSDFDVFVGDYSTLEHWTNTRSISRPATEETVLTVGAVRYSDLSVRSYSSRGPTIDGDRKPELMGPDGVSSSVYGSASTGGFTGTSAATPHVAGVAALVSQVDSDVTPEELRSVLTSTTDEITGMEPDDTAGYGLVNASAALEAATASDGASPSITNAVAVDTSRDADIGDTERVAADGDTVRITATVTDANPVVVTTDASPLGGPSSLSLTDEDDDDVYTGTFTVDATGAGAADGAYAFGITATDVAGNTNTVSTTLTLDTAAPALTDVDAVSDNPIDPAFVGTDGTLTVRANVSDATAVTGAVDLTALGGETNESLVATDGEGEFTATRAIDHSVTEGTMSFSVTVTDAAGNRNNATTNQVTIDHTTPTVSNVVFVNATDGTALLTEGDDAEVRATANDTHLDAVKVDLSQLGGTSSVLLSDGDGDGVYATTSPITSFNGSVRVDVTAVDTAGNEAPEQSSELLVGAADDTIAPVLLNPEATDLTDGDGEVGENNQVRLAVTVTDDTLVGAVEANASAFGGGTVTLTDDDGDDVYDGTFVVGGAGALAPNGSHAIGFTALDATRNVNTTTTNSTINTSSRSPDTPPLLSNASLVDGTDGNGVVADGDTLTVTADVVDYDLDTVTVDAGAFGVGTVTLTDADGNGTHSGTFTVDDTNVSGDGDHAVTVTALDVLGNTNTSRTEVVTLDTTAPTADAGADLTATADQSVSFDGSASHDATGIAEYAWTFGDSSSGSGVTPTHTYSEAGDYSATVTVTDAAGNTATDSLDVTVEAAAPPPTAGTGGGGSSSGGSSGGRSGGSTGGSAVSSPPSTPEPTPEPVEPEPDVTVSGNAGATVERTDAGISIDITDATSTDRVKIDLPTEDVTARLAVDGLSLESLSTTFARDTRFSADVSSSPNPPADGTPPVDHAVGYLTVDTADDFEEADVSEVRFAFAVSTERLREEDVTLDDVVLYRYHDGRWTALETRLIVTSSTTARFEAVSPGLSTFAIGSRDSLAAAGDETAGGDTATERVNEQNETNSDGTTTTPTVTSEATSSTSRVDGSTTSTTGPGFGELSVVIAFLVVVLAARRRTRHR